MRPKGRLPATWRLYPLAMAQSVLSDRSPRIWCSTSSGISRLSCSETIDPDQVVFDLLPTTFKYLPIMLVNAPKRVGPGGPLLVPSKDWHLEDKPHMGHEGARLQKMCTAERGQEVIERYHIREVRDGYRSGEAPRTFGMEQIVGPHAKIENVTRLNAIGIVVVILLAREIPVTALRKRDQLRRHHALCAVWIRAVGERAGGGGEDSIARQSDRYLLIRR